MPYFLVNGETVYDRVGEIFGRYQSFKVLLRPDNYIALLTPDCSLDDLKAYFHEVIGLVHCLNLAALPGSSRPYIPQCCASGFPLDCQTRDRPAGKG